MKLCTNLRTYELIGLVLTKLYFSVGFTNVLTWCSCCYKSLSYNRIGLTTLCGHHKTVTVHRKEWQALSWIMQWKTTRAQKSNVTARTLGRFRIQKLGVKATPKLGSYSWHVRIENERNKLHGMMGPMSMRTHTLVAINRTFNP